MSELKKKLSMIQGTLKAPKTNYNSFGKYKYRSCEDILEAVKPLLGELTLTLDDDVVLVGDRIYIKATATLLLQDEKLSVAGYARETDNKKGMDAGQITGAASSYARKYALNGLFLIDDAKDSDATNTHQSGVDTDPLSWIKKYPELVDTLRKTGYTQNKVIQLVQDNNFDIKKIKQEIGKK